MDRPRFGPTIPKIQYHFFGMSSLVAAPNNAPAGPKVQKHANLLRRTLIIKKQCIQRVATAIYRYDEGLEHPSAGQNIFFRRRSIACLGLATMWSFSGL
jgi:hypothetical protein